MAFQGTELQATLEDLGFALDDRLDLIYWTNRVVGDAKNVASSRGIPAKLERFSIDPIPAE